MNENFIAKVGKNGLMLLSTQEVSADLYTLNPYRPIVTAAGVVLSESRQCKGSTKFLLKFCLLDTLLPSKQPVSRDNAAKALDNNAQNSFYRHTACALQVEDAMFMNMHCYANV